MLLNDHTKTAWNGTPFVVRVTRDCQRPQSLRLKEALRVTEGTPRDVSGFRAYLSMPETSPHTGLFQPTIELPPSLDYLDEGDVVAVHPATGQLQVVYRKHSPCNSLFVTSACNNFCLMCAQPPEKNDDSIYSLAFDAIPLMDIDSKEIIITGGEPTILGGKLVKLIQRLKSYLPSTAVHILSNGRRLRYLSLAQDLVEVAHPDLVIGIPLYSDISYEHDFIVQARGAFEETIRGILNAARCGLNVELRIVVTRINANWLPRISRFIVRNLPFACNVAFMGLEPTGFAKGNHEQVWIDPADYGESLYAAVQELKYHRIPVSVYNHQLCTIDHRLWDSARQSISDWKNIYLPVCEACSVRHSCCGLFASNAEIHSRAIQPLTLSE
jgi:His-Xaa-Ser system radical SAM maturase HxsC